jgi:hypothetical protein
MAKTPNRDPKSRALQQEDSLHPHPEQVTDELFLTHEFFDPRDLVQVKYEMLRRVQSEVPGTAAPTESTGRTPFP